MNNSRVSPQKKAMLQNTIDRHQSFLDAFDEQCELRVRIDRFDTYANGFRYGLPGSVIDRMILGFIRETKSMIEREPEHLQCCQTSWMHLGTGRVTVYDQIFEILELLWYFEKINRNTPLCEFVTIAILSNYHELEGWNEVYEKNVDTFKQWMYQQTRDRKNNVIGPYELFLSLGTAPYLKANEIYDWLKNINQPWIRAAYVGCLLEHLPKDNRDELWEILISHHPCVFERTDLLPSRFAIKRRERSYQAWWRYTNEMTEQANFSRLQSWVQSWDFHIGSELTIPM